MIKYFIRSFSDYQQAYQCLTLLQIYESDSEEEGYSDTRMKVTNILPMKGEIYQIPQILFDNAFDRLNVKWTI